MEKNKVILIGGDDHNLLGLVRCFGINGIKPYGIIIEKKNRKPFVSFSKYWEQNWKVVDEEAVVSLLLEIFSKESQKPVVIASADGITRTIDLRREKLQKYFILPSIMEKAGAIAELMNKEKQVEFSNQIGSKMLETYVTNIMDIDKMKKPEFYPIILKPVMSVEGKKSDIQICNNEAEYKRVCEKLRINGYTRILYQKYLKKRTEYVVAGAVNSRRQFCSYTILKNIRQWPRDCGTGSYSEYEISERINKYVSELIFKLVEKKVVTPIDIEIFEDENGNMYINEFNWRCSGRNFVSLYTEVYSIYQYYCSVIGEPVRGKCVNDKKGFSMNEATDLRHVFYGNLSLLEWFKCLGKSGSFALWYNRDLKPTFAQYFYLFCKMLDK